MSVGLYVCTPEYWYEDMVTPSEFKKFMNTFYSEIEQATGYSLTQNKEPKCIFSYDISTSRGLDTGFTDYLHKNNEEDFWKFHQILGGGFTIPYELKEPIVKFETKTDDDGFQEVSSAQYSLVLIDYFLEKYKTMITENEFYLQEFDNYKIAVTHSIKNELPIFWSY